jgi:hypothetical protein
MQNETIIYGYARVSTAAQDESAQVKQLELDGCGKIFHEKITGTGADRPQLAKLIKRLAPGDVVITPAVDRLSRDTTDLLVIARDMQRAGAGIRSRAELSSIRPRTLPRSSLRSWALLTCSNAAAFWSAPRATGPTPRPRALSSAASRSPRTSSKRLVGASKLARRSAASPAVTMSARARFADSPRDRALDAAQLRLIQPQNGNL